MWANAAEIILIITVVVVVFGMGSMPRIAAQIGKMRSEFKRGLEGDDPIDITPSQGRAREDNSKRTPGKLDPTVEDARVDET